MTERERLNRFPAPIPDAALRGLFTLSDRDPQEVHKHRGAPKQLGTAPDAAVTCVAQQLGVAPAAMAAYGGRIHTRTTHLQQVQAYLGFHLALPLALAALMTWWVERALEPAKPTL